jgi:hypothetical protein
MEIPLRRKGGRIPITFAQELRSRETLGSLDGALLCSCGPEAFKMNFASETIEFGQTRFG